jgi:hypothetical protein
VVYEKFVRHSLGLDFDHLKKSKTVEDLYPLIPRDGIVTVLKFLCNSILEKSTGEGDRKWLADQFIVLLRQHLSLSEPQPEVILVCLNFFCRHGFFVSVSLSKSDQVKLRDKLFSLLSAIMSDPEEVWASVAVLEIEKLEDDHKKVVKLDSEIKKIRRSGIKLMKKLRTLVLTFFDKVNGRGRKAIRSSIEYSRCCSL